MVEMPSCSVKNCKNHIWKTGISFHKFPLKSQPDVAQQWAANLKRDSWKPTRRSIVCSEHFEETCFDRTGIITRLRTGAIPTIFDNADTANLKIVRSWTQHTWEGVDAHCQVDPVPAASSPSLVQTPCELQNLTTGVTEPQKQCSPESIPTPLSNPPQNDPYAATTILPSEDESNPVQVLEYCLRPHEPQHCQTQEMCESDPTRTPQAIPQNELKKNPVPSIVSFDHQYYLGSRKKAPVPSTPQSTPHEPQTVPQIEVVEPRTQFDENPVGLPLLAFSDHPYYSILLTKGTESQKQSEPEPARVTSSNSLDHPLHKQRRKILPNPDVSNPVPVLKDHHLHKPQTIPQAEVIESQMQFEAAILRSLANDHQYYLKPRKMIQQKENIQSENILAVSGADARKIASLHDFHSGKEPTLFFSFPQGTPFSNWQPIDASIKHPGGLTCKKCKAKYKKLSHQKDRRHKVKIEKLLIENNILKQENYNLKLKEHEYNINRLSETQRRLVAGMFRSSKARYDPQLINDSLQLRRISRPAYCFVKRKLQLPLPSEDTIRKYMAEMKQMVEGVTDDAAKGQMSLEVSITEMDSELLENSTQDEQVLLGREQNCSIPSSEEDSNDVEQVPLEVDNGQTQVIAPVETEKLETSCKKQDEMPLGIDQNCNTPSSEAETSEVDSSDEDGDDEGQVPLEVDEMDDILEGMEVDDNSSNVNGDEQVPHEIDTDGIYYMLAESVETTGGEQDPLENDQSYVVLVPVENYSEADFSNSEVPYEVCIEQPGSVRETNEAVSSILVEQVFVDPT